MAKPELVKVAINFAMQSLCEGYLAMPSSCEACPLWSEDKMDEDCNVNCRENMFRDFVRAHPEEFEKVVTREYEREYLEPGDLVWLSSELIAPYRDQLAVIIKNHGDTYGRDHLPDDQYDVFLLEDGNPIAWQKRDHMTFIQSLGFSFTGTLFKHKANGENDYKNLLRNQGVSKNWSSKIGNKHTDELEKLVKKVIEHDPFDLVTDLIMTPQEWKIPPTFRKEEET